MTDTLSPLDIDAELKRRGLSGAQPSAPQQPAIQSQLPVNPVQTIAPDQSVIPQHDITNEMLRRGIDPKSIPVVQQPVTPQATTGVDPGFFGRMGQYADRNVAGKPLPPLAPDAGTGSVVADKIERARDYLVNLENTIQRGLSFGTSDEVGALATTLRDTVDPKQQSINDLVKNKILGTQQPTDFWSRFNANDKAENYAIDQFKSQNPIAGNTAEIAGMITSPIGNLGGNYIQGGANMMTRALRAAGVGGALGGASGFASAEGSPTDRAKAAGFGAGAGALAGGILTPLVELGTHGVQSVYDTLANQYRAITDPQGQAQRLLANALMRDQQTVPQAIQAVSQTPDMGIVNAGGENVSALGRQATVAPGNARTAAADFFEQQAAGMPDRAADAVGNLAQNGYYGTLEQLDNARRTAAAPLYNQAYQQPAVDQWTPEISNLMQRPSMQQAARNAANIAAEEGRNPAELGLTFNAAGDPVFVAGANANGQIPSVQTMDYMKRGLDDVLEQYRDPVTGRLNLDTAGRAAQNTRAQFVQLLRDGNPTYAAALDAWGGPSHSIEMMNFGRDMWRKTGDPAEMIQRFRQLPANDQEMVRTGLMREAINKIGNLGDNSSVYNALFGNANKRTVFENLFPDQQSFDAFATAMRRERDILRTQRMVMGESPTARIQAENADAMQQLGDRIGILRQLFTGHPLQALGTAVTRAGNFQRGMSEPVANELGNIMFSPNVQANVGLLNNLGGIQGQPGLLQALQQRQIRQQALGLLGQSALTNLTSQGAGRIGALMANP